MLHDPYGNTILPPLLWRSAWGLLKVHNSLKSAVQSIETVADFSNICKVVSNDSYCPDTTTFGPKRTHLVNGLARSLIELKFAAFLCHLTPLALRCLSERERCTP